MVNIALFAVIMPSMPVAAAPPHSAIAPERALVEWFNERIAHARKLSSALLPFVPLQNIQWAELQARYFAAKVLATTVNLDIAHDAYIANLQILDEVIEKNPGALEYRALAADNLHGLAAVSSQRGEFEKSAEMLVRAQAAVEGLVANDPAEPNYRKRLGWLLAEKADFQQFIPDGHPLAIELDPDSTTAAFYLANVHWGKFVAFARLKRFAEADAESTAALKHYPERMHVDRGLARAAELAEAGDYRRAVREADELEKKKSFSFTEDYLLVHVYAAACGAAHADEAGQLADQALSVLQALRKQGVFQSKASVDGIEADPRLAPLRKRETFRKFVEDVREEASQPPK